MDSLEKYSPLLQLDLYSLVSRGSHVTAVHRTASTAMLQLVTTPRMLWVVWVPKVLSASLILLPLMCCFLEVWLPVRLWLSWSCPIDVWLITYRFWCSVDCQACYFSLLGTFRSLGGRCKKVASALRIVWVLIFRHLAFLSWDIFRTLARLPNQHYPVISVQFLLNLWSEDILVS